MGDAWIFIGGVIGLIFVMLVIALFIHGGNDR